MQIADEATGGGGGEGKRIAPEIPLEGDDGEGTHARPDHAEGRLPPRQTRVEETEAGNHDEDHGRGHDDVGLVAGLEPLVEVFGGWGRRKVGLDFAICFLLDSSICGFGLGRKVGIGT